MTVDIVVEPEESPAPDTTVVVAPTIVVDAAPDDPEPEAENAPDALAVVAELAVAVGALAARVDALATPPEVVIIEEPAPTPDIVVDAEDDAEVVIDTAPTKVPWTHRKFRRGGN